MSKKIIFMGTPMFAVPILKSLYQNGYAEKTVGELIAQYKDSNTHQYVDWDFFERLIKGAHPQLIELDGLFSKWLERDGSALPIELREVIGVDFDSSLWLSLYSPGIYARFASDDAIPS